jgi:hypothetical protein
MICQARSSTAWSSKLGIINFGAILIPWPDTENKSWSGSTPCRYHRRENVCTNFTNCSPKDTSVTVCVLGDTYLLFFQKRLAPVQPLLSNLIKPNWYYLSPYSNPYSRPEIYTHRHTDLEYA